MVQLQAFGAAVIGHKDLDSRVCTDSTPCRLACEEHLGLVQVLRHAKSMYEDAPQRTTLSR